MPAAKSLQCTTLCSEHARHMHKLERWALDVENKSHQDFLLTHQAVLQHAPQSLKENLHSSYHILLGQSSSSFQCVLSTRAPQAEGQPPVTTSSQARTQAVSTAKKVAFFNRCTGGHIHR